MENKRILLCKKISFKQFLNKVETLLSEDKTGNLGDELRLFVEPMWGTSAKAEKKEFPHLYVEWNTGGIEGGSCYENSDPQPYTSNEPEKELFCLDVILEHFIPNLSFLQYKALTAKLVTRGTREERHYYGNRDNYSFKQVSLKELYDYMKEKKWLEE